MSLFISPNQIQVTDGATTVFDLGRSTPHIIQSVSGTLNITNTTIYNLVTGSQITSGSVHVWAASVSQTAHLLKVDPNRAFLLCYFKINSLPTNAAYGQFNMFTPSSQWIGANGGILLRVWTSRYNGTAQYVDQLTAFQGTQFLFTYVDPNPDPNFPDYHRLYIGARTICGGINYDNDALDIVATGNRDPQNQFLFSQSLSSTSGQVDYRIFVGTF